MDYKIISENDYLVWIQLNDVIFTIEKETGMLCELRNDGEPTDVVIPHIFPSGHQITCLASDKSNEPAFVQLMVKGRFNKITISDDIFIGCGAFWGANVKEIVWNNSPCIPYCCFAHSSLEKITNIENVKTIMESAFFGSGIVKIIWPEQCDTILEGCFQDCERLAGISVPYVKKIENHAFYGSGITAFDWPADCKEIPDYCFSFSKLTKINNINQVTSVGFAAPCRTAISNLDLSTTEISYLAPTSLCELPKQSKIIPPYYVSDEDFENSKKSSESLLIKSEEDFVF